MSESDTWTAESSADLRLRLSKEEWRQLAETNEREWLAFPELPGPTSIGGGDTFRLGIGLGRGHLGISPQQTHRRCGSGV